MSIEVFLKGIIIGFSIAAPVGPIGILCIRRSLTKGYFSGFITWIWAASADAFYGIIGGFGLKIISSFFEKQYFLLQVFWMIFLFYLGTKIFITKEQEITEKKEKTNSLAWDYFSAFFLTLTNPMTIFSFMALFAWAGLGQESKNYFSLFSFVFGIFFGSVLWWLFLSNSVKIFHKKILKDKNILSWINKISGFIIIIFAFWILVSLVK